MFMANDAAGDGGESLSKLVASLGDPLGRRVLRHCEERAEPIGARPLAEKLGAPLIQVERHLRLLVRAGALRIVSTGEGPTYASSLGESTKWVREILATSREVDERRPAD
jgi:DNA-binding transcriptional ArsR family regulator